MAPLNIIIIEPHARIWEKYPNYVFFTIFVTNSAGSYGTDAKLITGYEMVSN